MNTVNRTAHMRKSLVLAGMLAASLAIADSGPSIPPCADCPQFTRPPYPHSGLWFNSERPGTGINIDVQNGIMAAIYYGYREDGTSLWLLTSGELQQSDADDVYWELETDLYEAVGGQPPGAEPVGGSHQEPDMQVAGQIHIEIMQRNLLRFSIDGGPTERMVPMVFGSDTTNFFPDHSEYRLPNFEEGREMNVEGDQPYTPWMIVQLNPEGGSRWGFAYTGPFAHWGKVSQSSAGGIVRTDFWFFDSPPHIGNSAGMRCGTGQDLADVYVNTMDGYEESELLCFIFVNAGSRPEGSRAYFMPIGNMGDRRFTAVSEDGWIIEGFRLMYD